MSFCSEAKRTLVKSPPELWAELSDAESLGRHLEGLGEIRITRTEPETVLEWEADKAAGSVRLEPSGFGTRVTLSLTRELVEPEQTADEPEPTCDLAPKSEPPPAPSSRPAPSAELALSAEPEATSHPQPTTEEPEPPPEPPFGPEAPIESQPRTGFFARLFRRRRKQLAASTEPIGLVREPEPIAAEPEPTPAEPEPTPAEPEPTPAEPEPTPAEPEPTPAEPQPQPTIESEPPGDIAADLAELEAQMSEQDNQMLTAMLDRLGAAHHRPFSRT